MTLPGMPNWPSNDQRPIPTSNTVCAPVEAIHETIQSAKAAGAVEGTLLVAPLAPVSGPIQGAPESMVVVVVKRLVDTPTFKAVRAVFLTAATLVALTFGASLIAVWGRDQSLFDKGAMDWRNTERACEIAGGGSLVGGLMLLLKKKDNNVAK